MGVAKVAVIGCGMMGRGIVEVTAVAGIEVLAGKTTAGDLHPAEAGSRSRTVAAIGGLRERALERLSEGGRLMHRLHERTSAWFQNAKDFVFVDFAYAVPAGGLAYGPTTCWSMRLPDEQVTSPTTPSDAPPVVRRPTNAISPAPDGGQQFDRSTKWALLGSGVALHAAGMVSGLCNGSAPLALVFVSMGATLQGLALVGGLPVDRGRIVRDILRGGHRSTKQGKRSDR